MRKYVANFNSETLFPLELNFVGTIPEGAQRILKPQKMKMKVVPCDQMENSARRNKLELCHSVSEGRQAVHIHARQIPILSGLFCK
jgi:hypothetical protein